MKTTIRMKVVITILPALVAALSILGSTALIMSRSGMIRLAMRSLSFKSETLLQFGESQWNLLRNQNLEGDPVFVQAARDSLATYARSLLRDESEWTAALNLDGSLGFSESLGPLPSAVPPDLLELMRAGITGPIQFGSGKDACLGQAFYLEPYAWYVVVSDRETAVLKETSGLTSAITWATSASVVVAFMLLVILSASITRPLTRVTKAMSAVLRTSDFSGSLKPENNDEIGELTVYFNALCSEIDRSYRRIGTIAQREVEAQTQVVERDLEALAALGKVAEYRDEDTSKHTLRVGMYARVVAAHFIDDEERLSILANAAPMHDLGKIGIPDSILLKPGKLTPEEFEFMKTHTVIGHSILKEFKNPFLAMGATISLTHHERWDGSGYPRGLRGQDIPLCGRILALLDVFDALVSERPYKSAWEPDKAIELIAGERGKHFDPAVVDAFMSERSTILGILANNQ